MTASRRGIALAALAPLGAGLAALAVGTAFGWDARLVEAIVAPPAAARAALIGGAVAAGVALLAGGLQRVGGAPRASASGSDAAAPPIRTMVRGIRLVFLAVAAFAAAGGWLVGHPLPIVVALVIAGIDVVETSFLLLVVRRAAS